MSEFMTSDLQLAAWLRLLGHGPTRIDGTARNRVFVFPSVPERERVARLTHSR
jgi:hypothetical protein